MHCTVSILLCYSSKLHDGFPLIWRFSILIMRSCIVISSCGFSKRKMSEDSIQYWMKVTWPISAWRALLSMRPIINWPWYCLRVEKICLKYTAQQAICDHGDSSSTNPNIADWVLITNIVVSRGFGVMLFLSTDRYIHWDSCDDALQLTWGMCFQCWSSYRPAD